MKEFSHPGSRQHARVDLNHAIQSTLTIASNETKYVADVVTDFGDIPEVYCFPSELNQVILNLVINAAHAIGVAIRGTVRRGQITVSTRSESGDVLISVRDDGCGIPEDIRDRIFEPFFTTKDVGQGTGQGLAIARAIVVDQHHGQIAVESEVDRGTIFSIRLPVDPRTDLPGAVTQ
jgi:signal transduction histidine kinase